MDSLPSFEPDLKRINSSIEKLSGVHFGQLSEDQLLNAYDCAQKISGDLDLYVEINPNSDIGLVSVLRQELGRLQSRIADHRFGPGRAAHDLHFNLNTESSSGSIPELSRLLDSKLLVVASDLSTQVRNYVASLEASIVERVTKTVCEEYNRVGIRCISSKQEVKRSVTGLRTDVSMLVSDKHTKDSNFKELKDTVSTNHSECKSSLSAINKGLASLNGAVTAVATSNSATSFKLSQLEPTVHAISSKIPSIETVVSELLSKTSSIENILQRSGLHSSGLHELKSSVASLHQRVSLLESSSSGFAEPRVPGPPKHVVDPSCLGAMPPSTPPLASGVHLSDNSIASPGQRDGQGVLNTTSISCSASEQQKLDRLKRKIGLCASLVSKVTGKDIPHSSKAQTIELVTYDLKSLQAMKSDLKEYEKQLDRLSLSDQALLDILESTLAAILNWEHSLSDLPLSPFVR